MDEWTYKVTESGNGWLVTIYRRGHEVDSEWFVYKHSAVKWAEDYINSP